MSGNQGTSRAGSVLELWQEVLDAMGRHDALGYLRRRCQEPKPAASLLASLSDERQALMRHLHALGLDEARTLAMAEQVESFYVKAQAAVCRWSQLQGDEPIVWPWPTPENEPPFMPPPERALAILHDTSRRILSELDLKRLMPILVERAAALTQANAAFLAMADPGRPTLTIYETHGLARVDTGELAVPPETLRRLVQDEDTLVLSVRETPWLRAVIQDESAEWAMLAPLRHQNDLLGLLCCTGPITSQTGDASFELLSLLANQTTIAIRNGAHYREVLHKAAALHSANEQLRSLDELKDQFLATVSHELRTPLNFITGFGTILLAEDEGNLTEEQRHFIQKMLDGAFQLLALVNDLLDYSRIQSGKFTFDFTSLAPGPLLAQAIEQFEVMAREQEITLTLELPCELPAMRADRQRIAQVLTNLIGNALKFTPSGGQVRVSAGIVGASLRIEVADTGVGIQKKHLPLLFQRFSQVDGSSTRQAGGTGLGLAISKSMLEAHGGEIGVVSPGPLVENGEPCGSAFWFSVPLSVAIEQGVNEVVRVGHE